ncbi:MAG: 30S ribosomal protein S4 [Candidatus Paceibacterota bacterium]
MKIGPKYKLARRLGASVFEKTSTAKFALRTERKSRNLAGKRPKARSNYGKQLIEKQKVRFTYCVTEKQFRNYVREVIDKNSSKPAEDLYALLEARVDSVVLRSGFVPTRMAARQAVSHGHITVNGRRITIPSYRLKIGDVVAIREGSKDKGLFRDMTERVAEITIPNWIKSNKATNQSEVAASATLTPGDTNFDLASVIQFYKR